MLERRQIRYGSRDGLIGKYTLLQRQMLKAAVVWELLARDETHCRVNPGHATMSAQGGGLASQMAK
jgi:hypothetical protein